MVEENELQEGYDIIAKMEISIRQMEHLYSALSASNKALRVMHNERSPEQQAHLSKMIHKILKRVGHFAENYSNEMLVIREMMQEEKFLDVLDELNILLRREVDEVRKPKIEEHKLTMEMLEFVSRMKNKEVKS